MRISDWSSDVCSSDLDCHLRQSLPALFGDRVKRPQVFDILVAQELRAQRLAPCSAAVFRHAAEIFRREHALCQRREHDRTDAQIVERVEKAGVLYTAVDHGTAWLVEERKSVE